MPKLQLDLIHADTCLSDFWGGHHLPYVQIDAYYGKSFQEVKQDLLNELNLGNVAAHHDLDEDWYEAAKAEVRSLEMTGGDASNVFPDLDPSSHPDHPDYDENLDTIWAFCVFRPKEQA